MTAEYPAGTDAGRVLRPAGPAPIVRFVIRPMTKVLNPLIIKLAGRRHFGMAAQIRHVGRHSGRSYVTPVTAHTHGDVLLIALTFGSQSDWSRNVRAAGECAIRINGRDYRATDPELLSREDARELTTAMFGPAERVGVRVLGIRQFMTLRLSPLN